MALEQKEEHYIGSTTRLPHDRVRKHLNSEISNSSVEKTFPYAKTKAGTEVRIIAQEKDPANLRLLEAFFIRKHKPNFNPREECSELTDLFSKLTLSQYIHLWP